MGGGRSRPDGTFTIDGLRTASYNVCAGGELGGYAVRLGVQAGEKDIALTLRPGGKILARVVGPDGLPRPQVWVGISKVDGNWVQIPVYGQGPTDLNGVAEVPTPAGVVELLAHDGKREGTVRVSVAAGETVPAELRLTESAEGGP
jgi:hypothetical protein